MQIPLTGPEYRALSELEDKAREGTEYIKVPRLAFAHLLYSFTMLFEKEKPTMPEADKA